MPSSGYGSVDLFAMTDPEWTERWHAEAVSVINECAKTAMKHGLFVEWLESFLAAWEATKDPIIAANAGLHEWDM